MSSGFGSDKERRDAQDIHAHTKVGEDSVTGDMIYILPIWNMHSQQLVNNRTLLVLKSDYDRHTLSRRKVYASFDHGPDDQIIDPRPYIYHGNPGAAYGAGNEKRRVAHVIKGLYDNPHYKNVLTSFKKCPCTYVDGNMDNCVPHNIIVNGQMPTNAQIRKAAQTHLSSIPSTQQRESIVVSEKLKKAIRKHTKNGPLTLMESLIMKGFKPTATDAINDKDHKWLGVSVVKTKQGDRYSVTCKGQSLGTYENAVDAARAYNDFVIDNGLPYPVNNIPGFLKQKFVNTKKEKVLKEFETWELSNEVSSRLMPGVMKF